MKVQVAQPINRTSLRFKSWMPDYASGARIAILAGGEPLSEASGMRLKPARALCIGPREWLIVCREEGTSNLRERIASDLAEYGLALTDVSDELAVIELRGSLARDVLARGCELDLHSRSFPVGRCACVRFADVDVVIDCVEVAPRFELYFGRSHFHYLYSWLTNAAVELQGSLT